MLNDPRLSLDRVWEVRDTAISATRLPATADTASEDGGPPTRRRKMQLPNVECNKSLVEVIKLYLLYHRTLVS